MRVSCMVLSIAVLLTLALDVPAQSDSEGPWWPPEWGPDDGRGAANRLGSDKVLEATGLIRDGRVYEPGPDYEAGMPSFPGRHFSLTIPGVADARPARVVIR